MNIGIISDTHLSPDGYGAYNPQPKDEHGREIDLLYNMLIPYFSEVEVVLHAGDLVDLSVIDMLQQFGEVHAISGNMDLKSVRATLPEKKILEFNGFRIGIIHGWGAPDGLSGKVRNKFAGEKLDCIVFGHSHQTYDRVEEGILMFNPGTPTDHMFAKSRNIGVLHLEDKIWGEHIYLD